MYYVSKVSPFFFVLALMDLLVSLFYKPLDPKLAWTIAVFGFIAHTIMSAMYQIVPNSQSRALKFSHLSYLVFLFSLICSLLFYVGWSLYTSYLYAVTSLIFSVHVLSSIRNWQPITVKFLGLGTVYFFTSSFFLVLSEMGYIPSALALHTNTLGFMLNVVMGTQLAWIPMLYMEPLKVKHAKRLFYLSLIALPPFLFAFYTMNYQLISLVSLLPIFLVAYFLWTLYTVFSERRMPKEIPLVVRYFLLAMVFLPFGILTGILMASRNLVSFLVNVHMDLLVYGFTSITVMGGVSHLLPRIIYGWKQSKGMSVSIQDFVDERLVKGIFPFVPMSVFWMALCDALGGIFSYFSSLPYMLLWILFFSAFLKRKILT
ncbi:MAG: hypothetical protein ACK4SM_07150 [Aquificaceae bacterium]